MTGEASAGQRPLIGVGAHPRVVDIATGPTLLHTASAFYVDAVTAGGGVPVVVPVMDPRSAPQLIDGLHGLVLTGGGDVAPRIYGQAPQAAVGGVDEARDAWDIALVRAALDAALPLLAICRGAQVLNVALGGSLVQDVPSATGARHSFARRYREAVHAVRLEPGCRLATLLNTTELAVNSLHHQAVGRPGAGVRGVGWAPDGTVEAVEVADHPEVLAVQWHPELTPEDPASRSLFTALVAAARGRQSQIAPDRGVGHR